MDLSYMEHIWCTGDLTSALTKCCSYMDISSPTYLYVYVIIECTPFLKQANVQKPQNIYQCSIVKHKKMQLMISYKVKHPATSKSGNVGS